VASSEASAVPFFEGEKPEGIRDEGIAQYGGRSEEVRGCLGDINGHCSAHLCDDGVEGDGEYPEGSYMGP